MSKEKITVTHLKKIMDYVEKNGSITNRECRALTGLSYDQGIKLGTALVLLGMLRKEGAGSTTKYVIPESKPEGREPEGHHRKLYKKVVTS